MPIFFLCRWKFSVMESDQFNVNELHFASRWLPFVLNTEVTLTAMFIINQMLCLTTCLSVVENICFITKLNWYCCLINCEDLKKFFPSLLLLFHNPIQNQIIEGEIACLHQLSKPSMRQCFFQPGLCCINEEPRM